MPGNNQATINNQNVNRDQYLNFARLSDHNVSRELKSEGQDSPLVGYHHSQARLDTLTRHSTLSHKSDTLTHHSAICQESDTQTHLSVLNHKLSWQGRLHTKLREFQSDHEIIEIGSRTAPREDLSSLLKCVT